jgi:hypothetical protein
MRCNRCWSWLLAATCCGAGTAFAQTRPVADREEDRRDLTHLSPQEKQDLQQKEQRFFRLPPDEQEQLRQLHRDLTLDPQAQHLEQVLERYTRWLNTLPSGQRAELLSLPAEERIAKIKQMLQQQETSRFGHFVTQELTDDDRRAILAWLDEMLTRREPELVAKYPGLEERLRLATDPWRRRMAILMTLRYTPLKDTLRPELPDLERLKDSLSPKARQLLEKAQGTSDMSELAQRWIYAALFSRQAIPPVDPEELRRFYDQKLDARQREYLESLPAERMQHELRRMFYAHRFQQFGGGGPPPFYRPGAGPRGFGPRKNSPDRPPLKTEGAPLPPDPQKPAEGERRPRVKPEGAPRDPKNPVP